MAVRFFAGDTFDVNDVLETVDGGDFPGTSFVGAADDGDFVVFAYRNCTDLYSYHRSLARLYFNDRLSIIYDAQICLSESIYIHCVCLGALYLEVRS